MLEIQAADAELTLTLEGLLRAANNLTTAKEGYALDARQGKALDEKKLDKTNVMNNINTSVPGYALDARQGKWLDENKIGFADVVNNLETNETSKPLSAAQGAALGSSVAALGSSVDALAHTVEELGNTLAQKPDLSSMYRVGDIYITTNSTSPAEIFGGTWERIKDRFLLAAGDSYTPGSTGGEATHTLTVDEMPSHRHKMRVVNTSTTAADAAYRPAKDKSYSANTIEAAGDTIDIAGGGAAHNNMPPYLAVYVWRRVA